MIEQDNIKELFSKSLENHTAPVRPEVWNGLQAKMAAAGVSSVAATKGISVLTKWIIGSAAVTGTAVVTTLAVLNTSPEQPKTPAPAKTEATTPAVTAPEQETITTTPTITAQENHQPVNIPFEMPRSFSGGHEPELPTGPEDHTSTGVVEVNLSDPGKVTAVPERNAETTPPGSLVISWDDAQNNAASQVTENTTQKPAEPAVIEFANVFTPNGDRNNDEYGLIQCTNVKSVHVVITNTENKTVFESNDPKFQWDGTMNGLGEERVPDGTYACVVIYQDLNGKTFKKINILDIKR